MKVSFISCDLHTNTSLSLKTDIQIQTPEFNSTSYLQYNPYTPLSTVAISFIPATPHGLLFYYGDYTQNRDFISIAMIEQRVELRYNLGSGPAILISNPVDLNAWHYVVVSLDGPNGSMIVDGGVEIHNDFEGLLSVLNAAGDMFVGGVSNYSTVSPHVGTEVGLTGCINDVEVCRAYPPENVPGSCFFNVFVCHLRSITWQWTYWEQRLVGVA